MSKYSVLSSSVKSGSFSYLRDGNVPAFGFKSVIFTLPAAMIYSAFTLTLGIILAISVLWVLTEHSPMP